MREIQSRYAINVIARDDATVLFLKRAADKAIGAGQWGFPAGHIEDGEAPAAAAERELIEECGPIRTRLTRTLGPLYFRFEDGEPVDSGPCIEVHLFQRAYDGGTIVLNAEHTEARWLSPGEALGYDLMRGTTTDLALLGML